MSLNPLLLRVHNFDGMSQEFSITQNWPPAGKDANSVHTLRFRNFNSSILEYTPSSGGQPIGALTGRNFIEGFFGAGTPVFSGETFDQYMASLEWMVSDLSGLWYDQSNVPKNVWVPLPSSPTIHSLTSFPNTGTNSYRFQVRKGSSILANNIVSWTS